MINLESEFSPRVNPADANYPFGSIKDNTSPGANDGTPLAAVWGNDWEGFAQAAMTEAGITPSGFPDTAQDSQLLDAVKAVASGALRPSVIEAMRRSYAESGYNLVIGSFERGGTLNSATDVLLHEFTGKAYSGTGPFPQTVPSDSTHGAGFTDRSSALLKTTVDATKAEVDLLRSDFDDYSHNDTNQRIGNGVLITAHRNGSVGTENSIMNYQKMMETGMYDGIELDMCISADGVLYNFHDRDVSIQTNGTGLFYELNSSYIDTLRYTATEGTSIAGEQIPKLHEVLRVAADFDCWVNAEIKFMRMDGGVDRYTDIHIMIDALKDAGVFEKCMLGAFNINYLTTAINYDKFSSINRYIFQGEYTNSDVDQLAALPSKGLKFMSLFYTDFTPAIAEYMRSKGVIPGVWTPNDPMRQETAIADGARIINSDAWGLGNLGGKK